MNIKSEELNTNTIDKNDTKLNSFKHPILYNPKVRELDENVLSNLELIKTNEENKESEPIYNTLFHPNSTADINSLQQMTKYYTTDTQYLKETQKMLKIFDTDKIKIGTDSSIDNTIASYKDINDDVGFCNKYMYIDWEFAKTFNKNPLFLQIMSIYNVASPVISLCLPIVIMVLPFFIIKFKGHELSISQYIDVLKNLISNHAITKIFTDFNNVDMGQKMYLLLSCAFYLFSIYQNILICIRFYSNIQKIQEYLTKFKDYLHLTIERMDYYLSITNNLETYKSFNKDLLTNKTKLMELYTSIDILPKYQASVNFATKIGDIMCVFYNIYENKDVKEPFEYSFGFNGYVNNLYQFKLNIIDNHLHATKLIKTKNTKNTKKIKINMKKHVKPRFKQMYYSKFINEDKDKDIVVKNDMTLTKNMIISGPNASGKTTLLKSSFINILLSQQFGYGCFKELKLTPYDHFHSYLNIPDTSGRDSLFQAEARRCKQILDFINNHPDTETHFCIFDELYSGTNPEDAISSAKIFMEYISEKSNITFLLTTHYVELCKRLSTNKNIMNYKMKTIQKDDKLSYTYILETGISEIKGGLNILRELDYPLDIVSYLI